MQLPKLCVGISKLDIRRGCLEKRTFQIFPTCKFSYLSAHAGLAISRLTDGKIDCAPTPSTPAQSKERKGSNFATRQPWGSYSSDRPNGSDVIRKHASLVHSLAVSFRTIFFTSPSELVSWGDGPAALSPVRRLIGVERCTVVHVTEQTRYYRGEIYPLYVVW